MTIRLCAFASLLLSLSLPHAAIGAPVRRSSLSNEAASAQRVTQYSATALAEGWPLEEGKEFERPVATQLALAAPMDAYRVGELLASRGAIGRTLPDGTVLLMPINRCEIWWPTDSGSWVLSNAGSHLFCREPHMLKRDTFNPVHAGKILIKEFFVGKQEAGAAVILALPCDGTVIHVALGAPRAGMKSNGEQTLCGGLDINGSSLGVLLTAFANAL